MRRPRSERFVILVPAIVTILVVMLVEDTYNVRSNVAPLVHHVANHVHHVIGSLIGFVKG